MRQDNNLRNSHQWEYLQYDNRDREISSGLMTDNSNYNNLTFHQQLAIQSISYPNIANYTTEQLSQTFYDNYLLTGGGGLSASLDGSNINNTNYFYTPSNSSYPFPQPIVQSPLTRGVQTGSKVEVLGSNGTNYIYTEVFYDNKARPIQIQKTNITKVIDKSTIQYSWNGLQLRNLLQHNYKTASNTQTHVVLTKNSYDPMGRVLNITKTVFSTLSPSLQINSTEKTIGVFNYDELGRKQNENLGFNTSSLTSLETRKIDYNIRGWILGVNRAYVRNLASTTSNPNTGESFTTPNPLSAGNFFGYDIGYDNQNNGLPNGTGYLATQYGGNCSGTVWKLANDGEVRKYDYTYDNAGRLLTAAFSQYTGSYGFSTAAGVDYTVNNISYDQNGNLLTMTQKGLLNKTAIQSITIDQLGYTYFPRSNQLKAVSDAVGPNANLGDFTQVNNTQAYSYDYNGNMVTDLNRRLNGVISQTPVSSGGAIQYNILNLPSVVNVSNSSGALKGTITYIYDAAGNKLQKITIDNSGSSQVTTTTNYIGDMVYQNDILVYIMHEEGRARINSSNLYVFDYFLKDQLGSVRMVLTDDPALSSNPILEAKSFYPMGLAMTSLNTTTANGFHNYFGYQGKEMQNLEFTDGTGLEEYDFSARFYDPQLGIWRNPDPANQFSSPYLAMGNNWPNGIDPKGKSFLTTLADIGIIGGAIVAGILTGGLGFYIVAAGGYAGASIESTGHWNPLQWNEKSWEGAITGELITGATLVIGETLVAGQSAAALYGTDASQIALSSSWGVYQSIGTTILSDVVQGQPVTFNDIFSASVSGAVSGAFQSNPIQSRFDSQDFLGINHDKLAGGVVSNSIGSFLSTGIKDGITGGWKGINFADEFSSTISSAAGQFSHQAIGKKYGNILPNLFSSLSQSVVGNVLNGNNGSIEYRAPFSGVFDFNSILLNLIPGTWGGQMNDSYNLSPSAKN